MENHDRFDQPTGFVPWMERHVLWRFRSMGVFVLLLGIEMLAAFCIIGIGVEGEGIYEKIFEFWRYGICLVLPPLGLSHNVLSNPKASPKKQTLWFLLGAAGFLLVVATALALVVLYYGFGWRR